MVKRSFAQSHEAPRRRSWRVIAPPHSAFHSQTLLDEVLAAEVGALTALALELALDHHLGGDAGMVGADHPQRVLALQPRVAGQDVLQRVVERVADMERAGDVGRRDDDRERLGLGPLGAEQPLLFPMRIPARLDLGGVEGLGQFGHGEALSGKSAVMPAQAGIPAG